MSTQVMNTRYQIKHRKSVQERENNESATRLKYTTLSLTKIWWRMMQPLLYVTVWWSAMMMMMMTMINTMFIACLCKTYRKL